MRVLIYGAGVQGSVYGGLLARCGHNVTFLARGPHAVQLAQGGLFLRGALGDRDVRLSQLAVVNRLEPQDAYDLCLVTVRREQVEAIMPMLAASSVPAIAFMHNHANGSETLARRIGSARTIIAFPGAGGAIGADGVVQYALIAEQPTMVGQPAGDNLPPQALAGLLRKAGLRVTLVRDPDAWLRRHAVMVGALTGALWRFGCDPVALVGSRDGVPDFIAAVREGYRALDAANVAPASIVLRAIFQWTPMAFSAAYWRRYLTGPRGELLFAAHARHAHGEMAQVAEEVAAIMRTTGVKTPIFDSLCRAIPA